MSARVRIPGLPRRANTIRAVSREIASKQLVEFTARHVLSYRIGYVVAVLTGGVAFWLVGWRALASIVALYAVGAWRAYRHYRAVSL